MTTPNPISNLEVNSSDKQPNTLSLVSAQASKITNVSLYSGRAEITRLFKLALAEGQNQVTIRGFSRTIQNDSVRVEGRGNASIHDVVISKTPISSNPPAWRTGSLRVQERKEQELKNQIASAKHARSTLDTYLSTLNAENVAFSQLGDRFADHALLARNLDNNILDLVHELADLTASSKAQNKTPTLPAEEVEETHLPWQVSINVWAQTDEEEAEISIIYAVSNANWTASYDIRADTRISGKNVIIRYKASIRQNTGESWVGVPLTLETVTPALGMVSPSLSPWILAEAKPEPIAQPHSVIAIPAQRSGYTSAVPYSDSMVGVPMSGMPMALPAARMASAHAMQHRPVIIGTNKGDVTATFRIPGYINVPSDAQQHDVTISSFEFNAPLLWHTIPKANARVYMEAKIKNESEYAFIPGTANMYVDGSFVATTSIPAVNPQETFSCPLGLDSSLRVTYHRQECHRIHSVTGFYKKSTTKTYTQRITIFNTKSTPIENLKVVDIIPVSQDERIEIKLLNPLLPLSRRAIGLTEDDELKGDRIQVSPGVVALWDGTGDPETNQDVVGKNGRVRWDVSLRPQEAVNLVLKFEVSYPEKLAVEGA
ncbi:hypothetical protein HYPSUDRAFT_136419 [Hypholoma sublateritium FD-334 SS-4]|uniref:Mucoidy inhibitor A n=1 Tax=Hypholoma sublateritium (strain FD-334 SS-4) TaxID=945553 RepID=A0A0D2NZY8_HYPSF|nr:hypothetical protein HYPSUDRAFT_136419 [Hypholoma sublateritium FD-334 SS-4]